MTPGHFKRKISLEIELRNSNMKRNIFDEKIKQKYARGHLNLKIPSISMSWKFFLATRKLESRKSENSPQNKASYQSWNSILV